MYIRLIIIVIFLSLVVPAVSQPGQLSLPTVDKQTWDMYLEKDWDGIIETGKHALDQGIDFYYLRVRLGIAWYEKGNYHQAIRHFDHARNLNSHDLLLNEYLYYSFIFSNRQQEARLIAGQMSVEHRQNLNIKLPSFVQHLALAYNRSMPDNENITDNFDFQAESNPDGTQFIPSGHDYLNLSLSHPLTARFSVNHGFTRIEKDHFIFYRTNGFEGINPRSTSTLNQYYVSVNALVGRGLNLTGGIHAINIRYPIQVAGDGPGFPLQRRTFSRTDHLGFVSMYKQLPFFTIGATAYYAGLNLATQMQADALLAFYPLGNLNLYTVSTFSFSRQDAEQYNDNQVVVSQRIGGRVFKAAWLEAYGSYGNMRNFMRLDGLLVYNTMDRITAQAGAKTIITISSNISLTADYSIAWHESAFIPTSLAGINLNVLTYNSHSLTGGLLWKF